MPTDHRQTAASHPRTPAAFAGKGRPAAAASGSDARRGGRMAASDA
jgi:hypothetical protein